MGQPKDATCNVASKPANTCFTVVMPGQTNHKGQTHLVELQVEAVLFDNDGVLVDSHDLVEVAWTELAEEFSLDIETLLAQIAGVRAIDTLEQYLHQPILDRAIARLEEIEMELAPQTPALHGAIGLLTSLPQDGWSIVTSASRRLALARWSGAGIPIPTHTITADDVARGKPDPEPFLTGAHKLGARIENCLVFEDSESGARAGLAAGAQVVAVGDAPWSFEPVARVPDLSFVSCVPSASGPPKRSFPTKNQALGENEAGSHLVIRIHST